MILELSNRSLQYFTTMCLSVIALFARCLTPSVPSQRQHPNDHHFFRRHNHYFTQSKIFHLFFTPQQAVIPGGSSVPVLDENDCQQVMMDFDDLKVAHIYSIKLIPHTDDTRY
jgi:hypothetical protein